ncbi:Rrf2 family transcriptional regulator [Streptosporangium sp. NPDC051023]|uniref:Rrf2 family transcriptional regulator n=1 Tax=Streptosporangium sp. NPDC051023 TaxID=3155410 RepID=UPI00344B10B1
MRLTAFTDISLRIVMRLAVARDDELLTTRSVAGALAVPYTHAAKAVARLGELGLVETRRGRGGGLRLTGTGRHASIGGVVRELEGGGDLVGCEDDPPCPLRAACRLRTALAEAREAFFVSLDSVTVDSLIASPTGPALVLLGPVKEAAQEAAQEAAKKAQSAGKDFRP